MGDPKSSERVSGAGGCNSFADAGASADGTGPTFERCSCEHASFVPKTNEQACSNGSSSRDANMNARTAAAQHVAVRLAATIEMCCDSSVTAPDPLGAAVKAVVEVVALHQLPVGTHLVPPCAVPALENAQSIQVPADAALAAPEPSARLVVPVILPQMPVCSNLLPLVQGSPAVQMVANSAVTTSRPAALARLGASRAAAAPGLYPMPSTVESPMDLHAVSVHAHAPPPLAFHLRHTSCAQWLRFQRCQYLSTRTHFAPAQCFSIRKRHLW